MVKADNSVALPEFHNIVNGKRLPVEDNIEVINPATGSALCRCPAVTDLQADSAIAAAKAALPKWKKTPFEERQRIFLRAADAIEKQVDEIARVLTLEQGKPLANATEEIKGCAFWLRHIAQEVSIPHELVKDDDKERIEVVYQPVGVVVGIAPWNFPAVVGLLKWATPVIGGNTAVLKPSPFTPLSTLMIGDLIKDIIPPGVVNWVAGSNEIGARLVNHPDVAAVSFTGSVATGKKIAQACSAMVKRCTLELGGNDAAIVRADCDIDGAIDGLFQGAFMNSGQLCCAIKRLYVHESKYDEVVSKLAEKAGEQIVGNGLDEGVTHGPINNKMQFDRVSELLDDAVRNGAKVVCGGKPGSTDKGYAFPLTLLTGVSDGCRIVDEEQFGPVLPVMKYATDEEVVERANNSRFGLGASVWGRNSEAAADLALKLEAGSVWVNQHAAILTSAPFGGVKESGLGREGGYWGIRQFLEPVSLIVKK